MARLGEIKSNEQLPETGAEEILEMRTADMLPANPRQRVSIDRSNPYVLSQTWQDIQFGNYAPSDKNTFPEPGRYDLVNHKFIANPHSEEEQQYYIMLYAKFTHKQRPVNIEFRYVVPRPSGDYYFPFPDSDKAVILHSIPKVYTFNASGLPKAEDTSLLVAHTTRTDLLPVGSSMREYGARLQMRTQENITNVANRPKLVDCYAFILPA